MIGETQQEYDSIERKNRYRMTMRVVNAKRGMVYSLLGIFQIGMGLWIFPDSQEAWVIASIPLVIGGLFLLVAFYHSWRYVDTAPSEETE